jgi:hypothetical protein
MVGMAVAAGGVGVCSSKSPQQRGRQKFMEFNKFQRLQEL